MKNANSRSTPTTSILLENGMFSTFNSRKTFEVIERSEGEDASVWISYNLEDGIWITQIGETSDDLTINITDSANAPTGPSIKQSKKRMVLRHQMAVASIQVDRINDHASDYRVFLNGTSIGVTDVLATDPVEIKFIQTPLIGLFLDSQGNAFNILGVILKHLTEEVAPGFEENIWEFTIVYQEG